MQIRAKKSLGQNFLKDQSILNKIANSFNIAEDDLIIEIGCGKGALTTHLQEKKCDIIAYEIDTRMESLLSKLNGNVNIIYDDFLTRNVKKDIGKEYHHIYIIANIPYYITTPIIEKVINSDLKISGMTLLVQKEVAERFVASSGTSNYGAFTVFLNYYFTIDKICNVKNTAFFPVPKVDSAVVKFIAKQPYSCEDEQFFFDFIKNSFQFKRKNLRNNLKEYNLEKLEKILYDRGFTLQSRAEDLSIDDYLYICHKMKELI